MLGRCINYTVKRRCFPWFFFFFFCPYFVQGVLRRVSLSRRQLKLDFAERMTALIGIETRELGAKRRTSEQETSESNARPRVLPERNAAFLPGTRAHVHARGRPVASRYPWKLLITRCKRQRRSVWLHMEYGRSFGLTGLIRRQVVGRK